MKVASLSRLEKTNQSSVINLRKIKIITHFLLIKKRSLAILY